MENRNNIKQRRILYIDFSLGFGGSTVCLKDMIDNLDKIKYASVIAFILQRKNSSEVTRLFNKEDTIFLYGFNTEVYLKLISSINKSKILRKLGLYRIAIFLTKLILERPFTLLKTFFLIKKKGINLVHINNGMSSAVFIAAKLNRIPTIITLRSFTKSNPLLKHASYIVTMSKSIEQNFMNGNTLNRDKMRVIYDGINLEETISGLKRSREEMRNIYKLDPNERIIGTVGRLVNWKRQDILISSIEELIAHNIDIKCLIVGCAENDIASKLYKKYLEDMVSKKGLQKTVVFTGFYERPLELMRIFDIFVFPSIIEPFGMVVLEAMALGVPVIAFDAGGPAEIIENRKDGLLVPVGDVKALSQAIIDLLENKELYEKLSKNAYAKIKNNFNLEKTVQEYCNIYDELLLSTKN